MSEKRRYFWHGAVRVSAEGNQIERFLNIASNRGIPVGEIERAAQERGVEAEADAPGREHIRFVTTPDGFKALKEVARKTDVRLRVRERRGLPFFLHRNRKRKLFAAGLLACFLFLYVVSWFIWDISFEGNRQFTDQILLHYLEEVPVVCGMRKSEIACEELEAGIRNHFPEITWVSVEMRGTRLIVHVKENETILLTMEESDGREDAPCDLAASRDGVIKNIVVRSGIGQRKIGESVSRGDLLVDGSVPIYDDAETLVTEHEVHADADIIAETVYPVRKRVPLVRTQKTRTGRVRQGLYLNLLGHDLHLLIPAFGDRNWEIVMEQTQLTIFEDFVLPVWFGRIRAYEYVPYEKSYTETEISSIRDAVLEEYVEKLSEKGIQILRYDGKIEKGESGWTIEGTLTVLEDIAEEVPSAVRREE